MALDVELEKFVRDYRQQGSDQEEQRISLLVVGVLLGFFAGAVTVSLIAYGKGSPANLWQWIDGFAQNFGTEMFGAFLTFLLFDRLMGERQKKREAEEQARQDQANAIARLKQAGTPAGRQAVLVEMTSRDLPLTHANLQGADLRGTDLDGLDLSNANLRGADLRNATLRITRLYRADLRDADLSQANLSGANLREANLTGAKLRQAILDTDTNRSTILCGASLYSAELIGADLRGVVFDEATYLPDGTKWTPGVDMERFTNLNHPDFYLVESGWG